MRLHPYVDLSDGLVVFEAAAGRSSAAEVIHLCGSAYEAALKALILSATYVCRPGDFTKVIYSFRRCH